MRDRDSFDVTLAPLLRMFAYVERSSRRGISDIGSTCCADAISLGCWATYDTGCRLSPVSRISPSAAGATVVKFRTDGAVVPTIDAGTAAGWAVRVSSWAACRALCACSSWERSYFGGSIGVS